MRTWQIPLASRRLVLVAGLLSLLAGLYAMPERAWNRVGLVLLPPLTQRFELRPVDAFDAYTGILVAGGSPERVVEAGRLARAHRHLKVYVSSLDSYDVVMKQLGGGIELDRIESENLARNTFENALYAKRFLDPEPTQKWLLVTSAFHMPRAMGAFRKAGFDVTAWPVDDMPKGFTQSHLVARHEWVGLAWYWLLGRTSSLFPSPHS